MRSYLKSDHFNGKVFFQPGGVKLRGFLDVIKWQLAREKTKWPLSRDNHVRPKLADKVAANEIVTTFVNHATHLIQLQNLNILTDPLFSDRTSPVQWAGPKRSRKPGLSLDELPKIDVVLISHNHYDHMDSHSIRALAKKFDPFFVVPLGNQVLIEAMGAKRVVELDWWQSHPLENSSTEITLVPAQHWSSRTPFDRNKALWGAFVVRTKSLAIFFAGDTGYGPHFKEIGERFGPFDLALLPIGAYEPRWFMKEQHMNPDDAVLAHLDLRSRQSLGIHFGTFQLTDEGIDEPVAALNVALQKYKVDENLFKAPEHGESLLISKLEL